MAPIAKISWPTADKSAGWVSEPQGAVANHPGRRDQEAEGYSDWDRASKDEARAGVLRHRPRGNRWGSLESRYLGGPNIEVVTPAALLGSQIEAQAKEKGCDYLIYSAMTQKKSGGMAFLKAVTARSSMTPQFDSDGIDGWNCWRVDRSCFRCSRWGRQHVKPGRGLRMM